MTQILETGGGLPQRDQPAYRIGMFWKCDPMGGLHQDKGYMGSPLLLVPAILRGLAWELHSAFEANPTYQPFHGWEGREARLSNE